MTDYRFYCFEGKPYCVYLYENQSSDFEKPDILTCDIYDMNWERLPFRQHNPNSKTGKEKPEEFGRMKKLSEELSAHTHFLRCDFYVVNGRIYLGELTLFPGGGFSSFHPEEWDEKLGNWLVLSDK